MFFAMVTIFTGGRSINWTQLLKEDQPRTLSARNWSWDSLLNL